MPPNAICRALLCLIIACAPRSVMTQAGPNAAVNQLSGRTLDTRASDWVSTAELERRLTRTRYVDTQSWNWSYYEPIIRLALDHRLPIVAANLSRADAFRVATAGAAAVLGATTVMALQLEKPLSDAAGVKLEQLIEEGGSR